MKVPLLREGALHFLKEGVAITVRSQRPAIIHSYLSKLTAVSGPFVLIQPFEQLSCDAFKHVASHPFFFGL